MSSEPKESDAALDGFQLTAGIGVGVDVYHVVAETLSIIKRDIPNHTPTLPKKKGRSIGLIRLIRRLWSD